MNYSFHVPLWFGTIKIKNPERLRGYERLPPVRQFRLARICILWVPASAIPKP